MKKKTYLTIITFNCYSAVLLPMPLACPYFNNFNIVSGVVCIFVMAHKPIPISFTLAPSKKYIIIDNQEPVMILVG